MVHGGPRAHICGVSHGRGFRPCSWSGPASVVEHRVGPPAGGRLEIIAPPARPPSSGTCFHQAPSVPAIRVAQPQPPGAHPRQRVGGVQRGSGSIAELPPLPRPAAPSARLPGHPRAADGIVINVPLCHCRPVGSTSARIAALALRPSHTEHSPCRRNSAICAVIWSCSAMAASSSPLSASGRSIAPSRAASSPIAASGLPGAMCGAAWAASMAGASSGGTAPAAVRRAWPSVPGGSGWWPSVRSARIRSRSAAIS